jgi:murein DD-endopeptidase MepM/ murein hydrolase activator NlpD
MQYLIYALLAVLIPFSGKSQLFDPPNYPKGYFRNPLAIPIDLSGNFGELRPNHYHMGLDLKTKARENQPVFAAADGYISRIKIEPAGFGRAIYINHPNGFTTLYAHLNEFDPAIERWLKHQQYIQESWKIFLELGPDQFPVKKGDFIAYSGNTGGSQAPHLHFEIRRTADDVNVNPMLFGFPLADNTKPRILRMAIYDRNKSMYEQSPRLIPVKAGAAGSYISSPPVITVNSPIISLAITAFDTHTGSSNANGVYESVLYVDDQPQIGFRMDNISYNNTRYLNAHIDYKTKAAGGAFLQQLSELPGFLNSIYKKGAGDGVIDLSDGEIHTIKIEVTDAYQNKTYLNTKIKWSGSVSRLPTPNSRLFYPLMLDGFETEACEFYIGERCLYDSVHIRYNQLAATSQIAVSALHAIGQSYIPLQEAFLIRIKPNKILSMAEKSKTVMQWYAGSKKDIQKVEWQQDWAAARFRDFGFYQLLIDTLAPQVVTIGFVDGANLSKASRIVFTVKDNLDKVKNVRAELDGKWLRFTNDKGRNYIYRFDEKCLSGAHELKITAEDEAGNRVEKVIRFVR